MKSDKMIDMGLKRKEMNSGATPMKEKDYENEKVYPEVDLHGDHAEMMGAEDLKEGDVVRQPVQWRVKRHSKTTEGGKTKYAMTLCLEKAGDCTDCGSKGKDDDADETAADEGDGADDSPAMAYIRGNAKDAG